MSEILRKITLAKCGLTVASLKTAVGKVKEGEIVPVLRVVGVANGYKPGATDKGEYVVLLGEFQATNLIDGHIYSSPRAILPTFVAEAFVPALQQHGNAEFALDVGARRNDKAITGYEFTMRPLMQSRSSDRLTALLESVAKTTPVLPAPPAGEQQKASSKSSRKR